MCVISLLLQNSSTGSLFAQASDPVSGNNVRQCEGNVHKTNKVVLTYYSKFVEAIFWTAHIKH